MLHAVSKMDRGGIENLIMNIYRNIDRKKIQFDFLDHNKETGAFDKEIIERGGRIFKINKLSATSFLSYKKELGFFLKEHQEYKIIHSHLNLLSGLTLESAKKFMIPVRIAHSHTNNMLNTGIKKMVKLYSKKLIHKYATEKFACSKEAAVFQFGEDSYNNGEVEIIPNGIDINKFKFSDTSRKKIRTELGIDDNIFLIGHSGSFRKVKNHKFLLNVFARVYSQCNNCKLLLLGDGELKEEIIAQAKKLNIFNQIIFVGSVNNVYDYLCAMDVFVFPSLYEGLGISVIEAQVSGLPCFISNTLNSEVILSDTCSVLDLSNEDLWASALLQAQTKKLFIRSLPEKSYKFDIKMTADKLEKFYIQKYCDTEYCHAL